MKNALIVDDTKNIRILLSKVLELEGFKVFQAKDAFEGLTLLKEVTFQIAFIDIKMPGMSGTALLEEIHKSGYTFPIIIMTAFGTIKNAVKTTRLGAETYLQKPFSQGTIQKTLEEVLGKNYKNENSAPNINRKIREIISLDPLYSDSYLKVSQYLYKLNEPELGQAFETFSRTLLKLEEE